MKRLAVFVSGGGTNLQRIAEYFAPNPDVEISCVVSNSKEAYANQRAKNLGIPLIMIDRQRFNDKSFSEELKSLKVDWVILAGFLWLVPQHLIDAFPNKIINIHPALLPKYGGKGFYGHHVHEAVKAAGEKRSGITIHFVNPELDAGEHIAQFSVELSPEDTPDDIADKVHELEMKHYPAVIEQVIKGNLI